MIDYLFFSTFFLRLMKDNKCKYIIGLIKKREEESIKKENNNNRVN